MDAEARSSRRSPALLALLLALSALLGAGFVALGVWQVHRLAWKEDLIARVGRQLHAAPTPAPGPAAWPRITKEQDEYRRVFVQGRFDFSRQTLVRGTTELGAGYWVLTPLQAADGSWVLVNRGYVPPEDKDRLPPIDARQAVVGLLRMSEPAGGYLRKNDPAQDHWYSRDVAGIAAKRGLAGPVAPYFIDAQATPQMPPTRWPRPGLTVVTFPNNHLVYAFTWFTLAGIMVAAIVYLLVDARRRRGPTGAQPLADRQP